MRHLLGLVLLGGLVPVLAAAPVREIDVRVPMGPRGGEAVAVRIAVPAQARYGHEAPIVIHVPGGWGPGRLDDLQAPLAALGFIELRFRFVGADTRGPLATASLARVIAFAGGDAVTTDRQTLAGLAQPLVPLSRQVGLLGWSNGGNSAVLALAEHDDDTRGVAWVATWESPVGDGAPTALLGDRRSGPNRAYDATTGRLDLSTLAWEARLPVRLFGGQDGPAGGLYLDLDRNGRASAADVVPSALAAPAEADRVRFAYPMVLLAEAERRRLLPAPWPDHLLPSDEATEFWRRRNAAGRFLEAVVNRPELLTMVLGSTEDHVQAAADHPHVFATYDGWRQAKAQWVRLNPDRHYLATVTGARPADVVATPAGEALDRSQLVEHLVPLRSCFPAQLGAAAAAELADRVHASNWAAELTGLLAPTPAVPAFRPR